MKTSDYLVCYDIASHKRLAKVAKTLERVASRIQKSVFLYDKVGVGELEVLVENLNNIIDEEADDIRIYKIDVHNSYQCCSGVDLANPYLLI